MNFLNLLQQDKPVFFDGGMGTELARLGLSLSGGLNNLSHPDLVTQVHKNYLAAGAQVITANTFTMNPIYMKSHNIEADMERVNRVGIELAKRAGSPVVLGDMGPTGQMMAPFGPYTEEEVTACYQEQALVLAQAGADGFIIETMMDLKEALCALKGCRAVSSLPAVVSFTLSTKGGGGRTLMGQSLAECARAVGAAGADVMGINCGELDPEELAELVKELSAQTSLPLLVMPNAGKPKLKQGVTIYDMTPEDFARGLKKCAHAGASFVGGCCGTTPAHIGAAVALLGEGQR